MFWNKKRKRKKINNLKKIKKGEKMKTITKIFEFDAAHYLPDYDGLCCNMHGHRWKLEAAFQGPLKGDGTVRDFLELEEELEARVISKLDHTNLNDLFDTPTTEIICRWAWDQLEPVGVTEIRLWETPEFCVIYRRDN